MDSIDFKQHKDYRQIVETISEELRVITSETMSEEPGVVIPEAKPFTEATDLTRDVQIDSASTMILVFALEEKFDVSVPLNVLSQISTIGDMAEYIVKLKTQA
jgi:acyl carrier protein